MGYRCFLNKQSIEYEATFILMILLFLSVLFEKFNRSERYYEPFNSMCYVIDFGVLILNLLYLCGVGAVLGAYAVRHVYRLMTETLLTNAANLQRHEIEAILRSRRRFDEVLRSKPQVNSQCSICFMDF